MVDVSMAAADPRRDGAAGPRFSGFGFGIAVATVALTVVATNVAVGALLWLAIDARLTNIEADVREFRSETNARFTGVDARLTAVDTRLIELNTRVDRIEGKLGLAPSAAEGTGR